MMLNVLFPICEFGADMSVNYSYMMTRKHVCPNVPPSVLQYVHVYYQNCISWGMSVSCLKWECDVITIPSPEATDTLFL